ncbi:tRNA adenosine deaminase-associated protein [Actinophytocola algeriensis]|uniref:Putative tRNA adenosine deaminase-associated protein n=1 Tax=Actinophytocola algeriensis TaxID=1768010 RepID=A0A7W7VEA7_9PSEU|nr:tRNA adenosine deaminase-associated protein [Actinophytocola algeriensis]MBB4907066.1 putative tRNA adenosine deaminase-associated protein [Actinophytocola algeriensis]MBE1478549.1 putative tRNA adenosine deaminase-associated protein [Actinophytocola algeriensis]
MSEQDPVTGFAIAVVREEGKWRCTTMESAALSELDTAITALRKTRSTGAVFGLFDVDDQFFLIVRPSPGGVQLLLSDSAAALDYDIAADALDLLRVDPPTDYDDDEVWPEGALDVLADIGLPAAELQVIIGEVDLYPDEQLQMIAQRCGFADELGKLLDTMDSITQ